MMRSRYKIGFLTGLVVITGIGLFQVQAARALDERLRTCGAAHPGNVVRASFDIPRARDYQLYVPGMPDNPELQTDEPAFFAIFAGPTQITVAGPLPASDDKAALDAATSVGIAPRSYEGVVCAVVHGVPTVYVDVDTSELKPP